MATDLQIPHDRQLLTAQGAVNGTLTVASTAKLRKGARVILSSGTEGVELVIDEVIDGTKVAVRDPSKTGSSLFNASAYPIGAALVQDAQVDFYTNRWVRW